MTWIVDDDVDVDVNGIVDVERPLHSRIVSWGRGRDLGFGFLFLAWLAG